MKSKQIAWFLLLLLSASATPLCAADINGEYSPLLDDAQLRVMEIQKLRNLLTEKEKAFVDKLCNATKDGDVRKITKLIDNNKKRADKLLNTPDKDGIIASQHARNLGFNMLTEALVSKKAWQEADKKAIETEIQKKILNHKMKIILEFCKNF